MKTSPRPSAGKPDISVYNRLESHVRTYSRSMPREFVSAEGAWMFDSQGGRYLDFLSGCSTLNYGHNHPVLKEALLDYIREDGIAHSLDLHTDAKTAFLQELDETILRPRGLRYKVMFTGPTGTNAVEAALKLARKATGRQHVIAFTNGFHGMTLGALACTGNAGKRGGAGIPLAHVSHEPYDGYFGPEVNTAELLEQRLSDPSSGLDAPAATGIAAPTGDAGTVVIFDCNAMHGSNGNITPFPRANAFLVYNAVSNRLAAPYGPKHPRPEFIAARRRTPVIRRPDTTLLDVAMAGS